ncbi:hypothetical protein SDC9_111140 [bioreactor metagenome]|uniref:Uncharacterized protein n=1 Tax=bioreactor metagenome TaxID=1076179 RepID=A0A645BQZ9_9ZZZZ
MSHETFERADRHAVAKHVMSGRRLGNIALLGGRAVRVHIADVRCAQARVLQRQAHRLRHRGRVGMRDVRAVAIGAKADHLGNDVGAARHGMLQLFKHEGAGALPQHQAVTRCVEGAWREFGRLVLHAGGEQRVEHRGLRGVQLFRATRQHRDLLAALDRLIRITDALAA